jgi:hypothetical protein
LRYSRKGNNATTQAVAITRQTPDLQTTQLNTAATAISGQDLMVNWTVQNSGTGRTNTNYWDDDVYLSKDQTLSQDDICLGQTYRSGALEAQGQYTASDSFKVPIDVAIACNDNAHECLAGLNDSTSRNNLSIFYGDRASTIKA